MRRRNHWICPQDDLSSWADCVLVFVTRLRRWKCAGSVQQLPLSKSTTAKETDCKQLERDGRRLPTDLTGVMGEVAGLIHCIKLEKYCLEGHEIFEALNDGEKRVFEEDRLVDVTLPPFIAFENISMWTATLQTES